MKNCTFSLKDIEAYSATQKKVTEMSKNQHILITFLFAIFSSMTAVTSFFCGGHDLDFLWHVKIGEYIVNNKRIFEQDIFSWVAKEQILTETAHSWLSEVIMYLMSTLFTNVDVFGAVFCGLLCFVAALIVGYLFYKEHDKFNIALAFLIGMLYANPRPQNIGYILFVLSIWILVKCNGKRNSKLIFLLPAISLMWANFHGGTLPILFAFEGLFLLFSFIPERHIGKFTLNAKQQKSVSYCARIGGVFIASIIAGFANPYGWNLCTYFFLTNDANTKRYVLEWAGGDIGNLYSISLLLAILVPLIFFKKQVPFEKWILPAICLCLGAVHQRTLVYGILAALPIFEEHLIEFSSKRKGTPYSFKEMMGLCTALILLEIAICAMSVSEHKDSRLPEKIVQHIKNSEYDRMYNEYVTGAQLIYENIPCFVDSRADLYDGEMLCKAIEFEMMISGNVGALNNFLSEYCFDAMLLSAPSVVEYMSLRDDWVLVFEDNGYYIFEPVTQ